MTATSIKQLEAETSEKLEAVKADIAGLSETLKVMNENILAALAPGRRQPVVQTNKWSDSGELAEPFSEGEAHFDDAGHDFREPVAPKLIKPSLYDVNTEEGRYMANLTAFYEEPVTIEILATHDPDALEVFSISVNGVDYTFRYGDTRTVPRYVVEGLSRAQITRYTNQEYIAEDGRRAVKYPARRGLRYQFAVRNDSPRGAAWLKRVLTEKN